MLHLYHTPVSPLLDFVDDFWLYDGYTQPHLKERILPSGTIELVLTSSHRQTPTRYGGGFQVCRLVGSRFFASDSSPAPLRSCPPLLFYSFRAISITMDHQPALRTTIDPRRQRDLVSMAASRAIL
jgi:hypothetical protein